MKSRKLRRARMETATVGSNEVHATDTQIGIDSIETGMQLLLSFVTLGGRSHQLRVTLRERGRHAAEQGASLPRGA